MLHKNAAKLPSFLTPERDWRSSRIAHVRQSRTKTGDDKNSDPYSVTTPITIAYFTVVCAWRPGFLEETKLELTPMVEVVKNHLTAFI